MIFENGKRKVLTLSYDDGNGYDKHLIEILDKYGLKATFNINTGLYSEEEKDGSRMTRQQAIDLYKNSNHEVAVHALTHPFLEKLSPSEIIYEIAEDRKNIERDFGVIARGMAYPYGTYNDKVIEVLKNCEIAYSRTTKATGWFNMPENWLTLHPTCHHEYGKLMELAKMFIAEAPQKGRVQMFYLWGHSWEFARERGSWAEIDKWHIIEEFAEYMGGRDDIWYATNIEIYDYVKAFEALQSSFDKKIIHNPTAIDVWFCHNGEDYCIKAGETRYL